MSEKQIPQENLGSQYEKHEQAAPTIENFEEAMQYTAEIISNFSSAGMAVGNVRVEGGGITYESLHRGVKELIEEVESNETDPNLEEFVTLLARQSSEGPMYPRDYTKNPMIAFLISRGAYEKDRQRDFSNPEPGKPNSDNSRRMQRGHQIIADGHVVRGHIVPGVGVRTEKGILRTRGNPRLGNS